MQNVVVYFVATHFIGLELLKSEVDAFGACPPFRRIETLLSWLSYNLGESEKTIKY